MSRRLFALLLAVLLLVTPLPTIARSLDFNGSNSEIAMQGFATLSGATELTWMAWINADAVAVRSWFINDLGTTTFSLGIDNAVGNGGLRFSTHQNSGVLSIAGTPTIGTWTHIALRWKSTNAAGARARFYINGFLQDGTGENTGDTMGDVSNNTAFTLGESITSPFDGRMFNMKLFKIALSQEQIESEMRCYRPMSGSGDSLVSWMPMDSGDKTIPDFAGGRTTASGPSAGISTSESTPPQDFCGAGG